MSKLFFFHPDECRPVRYETLCLVVIKDLSVYLYIIDILIELQILITKEDNYILVVTKKQKEEKYDHEDCKYCEQFNEGKI